MNEFQNNHPERFFQVGIAEANMMGIAAGMTIGGKIPLQELLLIFQLQEFMIKLDNLLLIQIRMLRFVLHMQALL